MADRTLTTYSLDQGSVEVTDLEFKRTLEMLKPTGIIELLNEFTLAQTKTEQALESRLSDMAARNAGITRPKEQKVNQLRQDLTAAQRETRAGIEQGLYTNAHAHQAKEAEVNQALLKAEYDLAQAKLTCDEEMARYLDGVSRGDQGSGATLNGVEWYAFRNILLSAVLEWSNGFTHDLMTATKERALQAVDNYRYSQELAQQAAKRLEDHKKTQSAKFGGNVTPGQPAAQTEADRKKQQAQTQAALAELERFTGRNYTGRATYQPEPSQPAAQAGPVPPQYMPLGGRN